MPCISWHITHCYVQCFYYIFNQLNHNNLINNAEEVRNSVKNTSTNKVENVYFKTPVLSHSPNLINVDVTFDKQANQLDYCFNIPEYIQKDNISIQMVKQKNGIKLVTDIKNSVNESSETPESNTEKTVLFTQKINNHYYSEFFLGEKINIKGEQFKIDFSTVNTEEIIENGFRKITFL